MQKEEEEINTIHNNCTEWKQKTDATEGLRIYLNYKGGYVWEEESVLLGH